MKHLVVGGCKFLNEGMQDIFAKYVALRKFDIYEPDAPLVDYKGKALLMYIAYPFFMRFDDPRMGTHIQIRNALLIVKVLNNLGYSVDVVDYQDDGFETSRQYELIIGIGSAFDYNKDYFKRAKKKVYYATGLHFLAETKLIYERYENLWKRRGVGLSPTRINTPYYSPEKSDCIISVQNRYTEKTYAHLNKPIYSCTLSGTDPNYPIFPKTHNTRTVMWLSGPGMVLKGLDLVLEAVTGLEKTCNLIICAGMADDLEFVQEYDRELTEYDNIKSMGFINAGSEKFRKLADQCIATIYPYQEGEMSGSLMTCMSHGLIPILSYFSSPSMAGASIFLKEPTVEQVRLALKHTCELDDATICSFSKKALWHVRNKNSITKEYEDWMNALRDITSTIPKGSP